MELAQGADFRRPECRREVFQRFYTFHLRNRTHPGCVYFLLPYLAYALEWDLEQRLWAAYLNGNTQNPVTTYLLMLQGDRPRDYEKVLAFWQKNFKKLQWDTDRRHHKSKLHEGVASYLRMTALAGGQEAYWVEASEEGWSGMWRFARALWGFGRLSAWSYLEYVRILGQPEHAFPDADDLMLGDIAGSQSHRNGLCLVSCNDTWLWDGTLAPGSVPAYTPERLEELQAFAASLLAEARQRNADSPDIGLLTLESALCTYKSWHKPNRRYPNVYADMLHDRIRWAEKQWGSQFDIFWEARQRCLPGHLRLEANPFDPGLSPEKQNFYLDHGCPVMMSRDWPCFDNPFDRRVWAA